MAVDTYTNLKAEIASHLDRSDLTDSMDTFIDLAEARHRRDIRIREMIARDDITISAKYVNLPDRFLEGVSIRIESDPVAPLTFIAVEQMAQFAQSTTGKPKYYTIVGGEFEFDRTPDATYTGQIVFYQAVSPLSDSVATNAILTRAPDVYLYGALMATAPYLLNDERLIVWGQMYQSAVDSLAQARRQERHMGRLVSRISGATP